MYPDGGLSMVWILNVVGIIWIIGLTLLVWQDRALLRRLFPGRKGDFKEQLEDVLNEVENLRSFKEKFLSSVQKVGLKRYNPYRDTGGDQSFSVALLDGRGDGLVLTSLHSRAGTRVFAKPVKSGGEDSFPLSAEEQEVVTRALT